MTAHNLPTTHVEIAVVGGGIGGLATAIALRRQGRDVHIYEQAPALGEVGGALVVRSAGEALLDEWGLGDRMRELSVPLETNDFFDADGNHIGSAGFPPSPDETPLSHGVHRADLLELLHGAVPADRIHLGATLSAVTDHGTHAELAFADGSSVTADLVVGADGIKSVVRRIMHDVEPRFVGHIICRGVAPADALPDGLPNDTLRLWLKDNLIVNAIPFRGGREFSITTIVYTDEAPDDLWASTLTPDEALRGFEGYNPKITDMIRASRTPIHVQAVHEIEPIDNWSTERVTLLGDAAHAMSPQLAQGANNALRDAGALAQHLDGIGPDRIPAAIRAYSDERAPHAAAIQIAARTRPAGPVAA